MQSVVKCFRRGERFKPMHALPVRVTLSGEEPEKNFHAVDLSATGMCLRSFPSRSGDIREAVFNMSLQLPGYAPFPVQGVLRHVSASMDCSNSFGVEFSGLSDHNAKKIKGYISDLKRFKSRLGVNLSGAG